MMAPRISVIIPVYNVEDYLRRCIDSVIGQNCTDMEIILVDDGSADRSGSICDEYAHKDSRIKVIHQENQGLYGARNAGLKAACGEYISFVDSDDWIEEHTVADLIHIVDVYCPDMIRFGFKKILNGKTILEKKMPYEEGIYREKNLWEIQLDTISNKGMLDYKKTRILSACTNLYRRELVMGQGIFFMSEREVLNEDYLFVLQVSMAARSVYISNRSCYCYDTREGSITMSYRQNMFERKKKLFEMYRKNVDIKNPEVQIRLQNFYIDCVYACIVNECNGYRKWTDSIITIRELMTDDCLQKYLTDNRELVDSTRTKCIYFMMRHYMSKMMYINYRLCKYVKNIKDKMRQKLKDFL